jgi:hypothetical protein
VGAVFKRINLAALVFTSCFALESVLLLVSTGLLANSGAGEDRTAVSVSALRLL